ncbi:hypothetical protein [Ralstonia sp.]|uniref:hypothetical protein n=1 Tax=Ralstonia sp. TaxID=54061 RepID=UPI0031D7311C
MLQGELPRHSDATPEGPPRSIIKLDSHSMVWAYDEIASDVEALSPFMALALLFMLAFIVPASILLIFDDSQPWSGRLIMGAIAALLTPGFVAGIIYLLKISLFNRYANLHFNRQTRSVYTQEGKIAVRLDWNHVRPFASAVPGPLTMGALPAWALTLVEFSVGPSPRPIQRMRVQGILPDRDACQCLWEFIRRYMDEVPEQMPELEVVPGGRTWQSALLDFGPMREVSLSDSSEEIAAGVIGRLRKRNWWPAIGPFRIFWWTAFWPGPLSTILYERFRREAQLPAAWSADEERTTEEINPYRVRSQASNERAGRRKATWIIGIVCAVCIALGVSAWAFVFHVAFQPFLVEIWGELFRKF